MSSKIYQISILIFALFISILLVNSSFAKYELQVTALTFIIYFLFKKRFDEEKKRFFEAVLFTFVISNIINSTGALNSPFFFLNYFLIFSTSLLLVPQVSLALAVILVIFFTLGTPEKTTYNIITLVSLPFLTPFTIILGKEYQTVLEQKKIIKILAKDREKSLLFLSLIVKKHLKKILETSENFTSPKDLGKIEKVTRRMERLIDQYERQN